MPLSKTVLFSFFIPQGQKQIVGSESFPGARFIYFLIPVERFQQLSCRGKSAAARQEGEICYILKKERGKSPGRDSTSDTAMSQSAVL